MKVLFLYFKHVFVNGFFRFKFRLKLKQKFPAVSISDTVSIHGPLHHLTLGENCIIDDFVFIHLGGYEWSDGNGNLQIGRNGVISSHCVFYCAGEYGIKIGDYFDCAPGVKVFSSKSFFEGNKTKHDFGPVIIGNHVVLYANVVVSPGITIGDNITVAANSVVTHDLLEPGLYGGCPAKKIK